MFWVLVLHLTVNGADVLVAGPPVAFVNERECESAVAIVAANGSTLPAECRLVRVLSSNAEPF